MSKRIEGCASEHVQIKPHLPRPDGKLHVESHAGRNTGCLPAGIEGQVEVGSETHVEQAACEAIVRRQREQGIVA